MKISTPGRLLVLAICASLPLFAAARAEAASASRKLERCRAKILSRSHAKALDCFAEVMADGSAEERKAAGYFLDILGSQTVPYNVPTLEQAYREIRAPKPHDKGPVGGAVPVAVIYHGRPPEPVSWAAQSRYDGGEEAAPRPAPPVARPQAPKKKVKPVFLVEDMSGNVSGTKVAVAQAGGKVRSVRMVGGGLGVQENQSELRQAALASVPAETIEVSSFVFKEMLRSAPEAAPSTAGAAAQPQLAMQEVRAQDLPPSLVAVAGSAGGAADFSMEDDISPQEAIPSKSAGKVSFDFDSAGLTDAQFARLERSAEKIIKAGLPVLVRGSAGPEESNPENLSEVRAKVVLHILKKKFRVPKKLLSAEWSVGVNRTDQAVYLLVKQAP